MIPISIKEVRPPTNNILSPFDILSANAITASGTRKNDLIFGEIQSQIKNNNIHFDVKTNSDSNNNKGDNLSASYYRLVNPLSSTAVGAELTHSFSSNENTLDFGTQHTLDPWCKSFFTISAEVDTRAIEER
ncbi:hypothetical protein C4D60_Mb01t00020 [Musa balbisiana]|uniref:Uncharacterized protein n=1 Tax=Musa balbisiana TaxID=52838 RepID=A0A4S8JIY6_MUSBA|nr:hypothetical protein C4D60_Mb01t00020 [Musa balbisiana]